MSETVYTLLQACIVCIQTKLERGTGFWVAPGIILTCAHVIKDTPASEITLDWEQHTLKPEKVECVPDWKNTPHHDLALIHVDFQDHPCVYLGEGIIPGDSLHSYGYPDPLEKRKGDSLRVEFSGPSDDGHMLTLKDENIRGGFSGAPLLHQKSFKVCGLIKSDRSVRLEHVRRLGGRGIPTGEVYRYWPDLKDQNQAFHQNNRRWKVSLQKYKRPTLKLTALSVVLTTAFIVVCRSIGFFQPIELSTYDWLMRTRKTFSLDKRITLIQIFSDELTETEFSDSNMKALLSTINSENPRLIGLDIFRDEPQGSREDFDDLTQFMEKLQNFVLICKVSDPPEKGAIPPSKSINTGFSDALKDKIGSKIIIRRALLRMPKSQTSPCKADKSLGYQIALDYLGQNITEDYPDGIHEEIINRTYIKIGQTIFDPIWHDTGGYNQLDDRGHQILLNYRKSGFESLSLQDILDGLDETERKKIKGRIVLIGYDKTASESKEDIFLTPIREMPGVEIHANITSHILSLVLNDQDAPPLIRSLWESEEILIIIVSCLLGGIILFYSPSKGVLLCSVISGVTISVIFSWLTFSFAGLWLPLVPCALGLSAVPTGRFIFQRINIVNRDK